MSRGTEAAESRAQPDLGQVPNPEEALDGTPADGPLNPGGGAAPVEDDQLIPGLRAPGKGQLTEGDGPKLRTPLGQLAWSDLDRAVRSAENWEHGSRTPANRSQQAQARLGQAGGGQLLLGGDGPAIADRPEAIPGAVFVAEVRRRALGWARRRSLGLSSACGISVALAVCAATWFSAGTRLDDSRGAVALGAGYLVLLGGRSLAGASDGTRWRASLSLCLSECAIYAGLAAGAAADHGPEMWILAIAVLGLVSARDLMTTCSNPPALGERSGTLFQGLARAVLTMPTGGRVLLIVVTAPAFGARVSLLALLDWAIISVGYGVAGRAVPALAEDPAKVVRLRDDGAIARTLGMLVRGQLLPLPPAILGVAAVATLVILGLHGLPSILIAGPAIVMLLAAPGSSNRHSGRFDWLVPVLLLGAQILYLAAAGLATGVPGLVIFALCSVLLVHYADLAFPGRPVLLAQPRQPGSEATERGTSLGWEGRLLLAGMAAALGIATYAYIALAAYLASLIGAKAVASCLRPRAQGWTGNVSPGPSRQP